MHSTVWSAAYARRSAAFEAQLDACVDELGLTPDAVERVMQTALELAGSQRCVPTRSFASATRRPLPGLIRELVSAMRAHCARLYCDHPHIGIM